MDDNALALSGTVAAVEPLRHTPAGIPVLTFRITHQSRQTEAGFKRQVDCEVPSVAMGEVAQKLSRMREGERIRIEGFLNRKNRMSAQLILHVTNAELLKE